MHVEARPDGLWAVGHLGHYLARDGLWSPLDNHTDWRTQREAMGVACRAAREVEVNGRTAEQCGAWERSQRAVSPWTT